jgi:hypothetical protein
MHLTNLLAASRESDTLRLLKQVSEMEIRREQQINRVGDDVLAITAVVRPILTGLLNALKPDIVKEAGGR